MSMRSGSLSKGMASAPPSDAESLTTRAFIVSSKYSDTIIACEDAISTVLERNFPNVASVITISATGLRVAVYGPSDSLTRFAEMVNNYLPEFGVSAVSEVDVQSSERENFLRQDAIHTSQEYGSGRPDATDSESFNVCVRESPALDRV